MFLSIIFPVFNIENYLKICIDSIISQSFVDYELILVDDGSTDRSGEICDEYSRCHSNIKVIHEQNGGISTAWLAGLAVAQADFIMSIDSDD